MLNELLLYNLAEKEVLHFNIGSFVKKLDFQPKSGSHLGGHLVYLECWSSKYKNILTKRFLA